MFPDAHKQENALELSYIQLSVGTTPHVSHVGGNIAEAAAQIHLSSISSHNVAAPTASAQQLCVVDVSAGGFRRTPDVEIRKLFLIRGRNNSYTARCERVFRQSRGERVGAVCRGLSLPAGHVRRFSSRVAPEVVERCRQQRSVPR